MSEKKTDLRILRTRKAIRDTFCEMIAEMDYEEITIKELSQRAMINRNTFYLHYDSIATLMQDLQNEIISNFIEKPVSYDSMDDIKELCKNKSVI